MQKNAILHENKIWKTERYITIPVKCIKTLQNVYVLIQIYNQDIYKK